MIDEDELIAGDIIQPFSKSILPSISSKEIVDEIKEIMAGREKIIVKFSGGRDSTFALLWAYMNFKDKEIIPVFSDSGVEFPSIVPHVYKVCDFFDLHPVILKPEKNVWGEILNSGTWPSVLFRDCQQNLLWQPIDKFVQQFPPKDIVIIGGSTLKQKTPRSKQTVASSIQVTGVNKYTYYRPCYRVNENYMANMIDKYNVPLWEGYSRGFVRTACWMCPAQSGSQAYALYKNYPELVKVIQEWEEKLGKPLNPLNNISIMDLVEVGGRKKKNKSRSILSFFED